MDWDTVVSTKEYARLHYSSSLDRGFDNLLYIAPWIKEKVPELTIHSYYGMDGWRIAAASRNDTEGLRQIDSLEKQIESMKEYVFFHGRLTQPELAKEWAKAYIWLYPTNFSETYCLTACEAQLSATPIVCSNLAALETTVGEYGMRVMHHPYSREGRQFFIDYTIQLCTQREQWEKWSKKSYEGALRRFSWQERFEDFWQPWC